MATYTGLDGIAGNAFVIVAGGIDLTAGEVVTQTLLVPDSTRTDRAFSVGTRVTEKDVTIGAGSNQNLDPLQLNLNIIGVNPGNSSTINGSYKLITHDTQAMANIRLKCSDWSVSVGVNVQDVYVSQGQIDFTAGSITVGGEVAVLGLVLNGGGSSVTATGDAYRVINCTLRGSGTPAEAHGIMVNAEGGLAVSEGIRCIGTGMDAAIRCGTGEYTQSPVNFAAFPTAGTQPVSSGADASGDVEGSIAIRVGTVVKYLHFWPNAS